MKRSKILHFAPAYQNRGGGIYEVVENLSEAQCADGKSTVDIIALETFVGRHPINKNIYNLLPSKFSQFKLMAEVLNFLFRQVKSYDVIHIHGAWSVQFLLILPFILKNRSKIVYQPHGLLCPERIKKNWFFKKIAWTCYQQFFVRFNKCIVCCSERERADLLKLVDTKKKLVVIPNGVDRMFLDQEPCNLHRENTLLYFSQIVPIKNLESLFVALSRLRKIDSYELCLDIYGYGPLEYINELKVLSSKLLISDIVEFKGAVSREDRVPIFDKYNYFILPSLSENFGIAVLEGLIRGCKVFVSKSTPWDRLEHPSLVLFEPCEESIYSTLKSAIVDKNLSSENFSKSNFDIDDFKWENIATKFQSIYFDKVI